MRLFSKYVTVFRLWFKELC